MSALLCPRCGSAAIAPRLNLMDRPKLLGVLPYTALTTLAFSKSEYQCSACGQSHERRSPSSKLALALVLVVVGGLATAIISHS